MKCQSLFSGKNKESIINLSSTESAHSRVRVKRKNLLQSGKQCSSRKGKNLLPLGNPFSEKGSA